MHVQYVLVLMSDTNKPSAQQLNRFGSQMEKVFFFSRSLPHRSFSWILLCFSHCTVQVVLGEVVTVTATNKEAGVELSSTGTLLNSCWFYWGNPALVGALQPSPSRQLSTLFPRHLQHVSFLCGRERKWNGKSSPPPTAATLQGRRAVGQEPAGHSRAYLWSPFSSLQSEPLCSPACCLCMLLLSPCDVSHCL